MEVTLVLLKCCNKEQRSLVGVNVAIKLSLPCAIITTDVVLGGLLPRVLLTTRRLLPRVLLTITAVLCPSNAKQVILCLDIILYCGITIL